MDEVRSIDSRQRHTWARPSARSRLFGRPRSHRRVPAASRAAAPARGAIPRLQRAQAEAPLSTTPSGGPGRDAARLNQHGRRDGHAQAGGGRFQHVPQMIEFAAGMTRASHADAAGPPPGLGPRAVCSSGASSTSAGRDRRAARLARRPGRWPRPAAASRFARPIAAGQISASTRRVFSRRRPPRSAGGCGCRDARPRNAPAGDEPVGQETWRAHGQLGRLGAAPERRSGAPEGVLGRALQVQAGGGQLDAAGAALEQRQSNHCSSCRICWLTALCVTVWRPG